MKNNREINQQVLNTAVDKKGRPTINLDKRKSIYESVTEALRAIPVTNRNVGLTIPIYNGVKVVEYWWEKGIKDSDFVKKIDSENIPRINSTLVSLQNQIDSISSFEFKVVLSLPEKGKSGIIYVVPAAKPTSTNIYDEYFWIESAQSYERWGGVDPEGDIVINNAFTFNENHFNVVEEYGIQNVALKCDLLDVTSTGFNIYKLAIGEDDNEILLSAEKISRSSVGASSYGGTISLNGKTSVRGRGTTTFGSIFSFSTLSLNSDNSGVSKLFLAQPNYLKIADDTNYIELSGDSIAVYSDDVKIFDLDASKLNIEVDKFFINTQETNGFALIVDDTYGISANKISESIGMGVNIFTDHSRVAVRSNTITLESSKVSATNLYLTDTQGSIQKGFEALYDTSYAQLSAGIRATCSVWVQNTDLFGLRSTDNSSRTLLRLNDIIYRKSTTPNTYGTSIISWNENTNKYPELKLGWNQELQFNENRIDLVAFDQNSYITDSQIHLSHGDANCVIYNNGECGFYTSMYSNIKILTNGDIKLEQIYNHIDVIDSDNVRKILIESGYQGYRGFIQLKANTAEISLDGTNSDINMYASTGIRLTCNTGYIDIDSDGFVQIKGNTLAKMFINGTNASSTYFIIEEGNFALPDMQIHHNTNNYISLYKNDSNENNIVVRTDYFTFKDSSNNTLFTIDSDGDSNWNLSNEFKWSLGSNKTVKIVATGIEYFDGTNTYTKTWAQIFS